MLWLAGWIVLFTFLGYQQERNERAKRAAQEAERRVFAARRTKECKQKQSECLQALTDLECESLLKIVGCDKFLGN